MCTICKVLGGVVPASAIVGQPLGCFVADYTKRPKLVMMVAVVVQAAAAWCVQYVSDASNSGNPNATTRAFPSFGTSEYEHASLDHPDTFAYVSSSRHFEEDDGFGPFSSSNNDGVDHPHQHSATGEPSRYVESL